MNRAFPFAVSFAFPFQGYFIMDNTQKIIADLYDVIREQHRVISYLVVSQQALVETLANFSEKLPYFSDSFQNKHSYARKHPKGPLVEALSVLQDKLDVIGKTLKLDIGGWEN